MTRHGLNERRIVALENLEERLSSEKKLLTNAKRFKGGKAATEAEINKYREFLKAQVETLKKRIER